MERSERAFGQGSWNASILGVGSYLPKTVLDNRTFYKQLSGFDVEKARYSLMKKGVEAEGAADEVVFDHWVQQVCGVRQRPFATNEDCPDPKYLTEFLAAEAAKKALDDAGLSPADIDHMIYATFTSQFLVPPPSCTLQHYLGMKNVSGFTLNSACNGFLDSLIDAAVKVHSGAYETILVVSSEVMSRHINLENPTTAILFSDGAGAFVVGPGGSHVLGFKSNIQFNDEHIFLKVDDDVNMQGGPLVQRKAIMAMSSVLLGALELAGLDLKDLDYIVPHQANLRIIQGLEAHLKLPSSCKMIECMGLYPNSSSASVPTVFDLLRQNKLEGIEYKSPARVGFVAVGAGYTFSALVAEV